MTNVNKTLIIVNKSIDETPFCQYEMAKFDVLRR